MEMRRDGKEVAFQDETSSLKTINTHVFTWYSQKYIQGKTNSDFPNKIDKKLKDLKLFKVLRTTY